MNNFFKNLFLKPNQVTWINIILPGLIVLIIGLFGSSYMINYLNQQITTYEVKHNKEVAADLLGKFDVSFKQDFKDPNSPLGHSIKDYKALGLRIFLLDMEKGVLVADNELNPHVPLPIEQSWLTGTPINYSEIKTRGSTFAVSNNNQSMLIWFQKISQDRNKPWVLGVARDYRALTGFMDDLHIHMNAVILFIFALITIWGFFAVRSISGLYELYMEKKLEECTRELNDAYLENLHKSRLATIGQTASVLAHEMHNPMSSIKLALSGLKGSSRLSEREIKRVDLVLGEVDRLDSLLSETLDYVRPVKLSEKPVDMELLLKQVIKQEEPVIRQNEIKFEHSPSDKPVAMCIDKAQFHQVLLNLIKNAIEASPKGGLIKTAFKHIDHSLRFEIANSGKPMDKVTLARAFEPFYTTKSKGTGLGLGLVKRVVDEHKGQVNIESNAKTGTKLTIIFESN